MQNSVVGCDAAFVSSRQMRRRRVLLGTVSLLPLALSMMFPARAHAGCSSTVITASCTTTTIDISSPGNFTVTNTGVLDATGLRAVDTQGYDLGTLLNDGRISAEISAVWNSDGGIIGTLSNAGTLSALGYGVENTGEIGTLYNQAMATISAVSDTGIQNFGSVGMISNSGTITGGKIGLLNETTTGTPGGGVIGTLTNGGLISGGTTGLSNEYGSIGLLSNSGTINGGQFGLLNSNTSGAGALQIGTLSNIGLITGANTGLVNQGGTIGLLSNGGRITGASTGILNEMNGTILELSNTGSISNIDNSAVIGGAVSTALYNDGTIGALSNYGTISGLTNGVANARYIDTLSNAGTIMATNPYEAHDVDKRNIGLFNEGGGTIGALFNNLGGVIAATSSGLANAGSIGLLSNDGTITGVFSEGVYNQSSGVIGTLLNNHASTIFGGATGIVNSGTINMLINHGSIIGGDASGIANYHGLIGSLTNSGLIAGEYFGIVDNDGAIGALDNTGTVTGGYSAIQVNNGGDIATLTNSGTISSTQYGVHNRGGTIGLLDNQAPGVIAGGISSGDTGVFNEYTITALSNEGTISGGSGIDNHAEIDSLSNTGMISGTFGDGLRNATAMIGSVQNGGTIAGAQIGVQNVGATAEDTVMDAIIATLSNTGMITGAVTGVYTNQFGVMSTLANTGTLAVIAGGTDGVFNDGAIGLLGNAGTIITTLTSGNGFIGAAVVGVLNSHDGSIGALDNLATGTIIGGSSGVYNLGSIGLLSNSGLIGGASSGIDNEGAIGTLTNAGIIAAGSTGVDNEGGSIGALTNHGTISGNDAGILNTYNRGNAEIFGTIARLDNAALITGGTTGVANDSGSTIFALSNTGTIFGGIFGVYDGGGIGTLDNAGLIEGGHIGVQAVTGSIGAFDNIGTIIGGAAGVELVDGTLVNSGLIAGTIGVILTGDNESIFDSGTIASTDGGDAILFQAPDPDSLTLSTGADIIGTIDGGGTAGQITLEGDGTLDDTVAGFTAGSALNVAAGANWAGAGAWTIASLTNDGTFQGGLIGTPLTLAGNFVQTPNGTLLVAVTPSGNTQFLVDGSVTLAGGLKYEFAPGTYHAGTYAFITATGGITGGFASAAYDGKVPSAFTHATLQQLATGDLVLTAIPGGGPGAPVAGVVAPADSTLFGDSSQAVAYSAQAATAGLLTKASEGAAAASDAAACAAQAADMNATGNGPNVSGAARMATAIGQAFCAAGGWVEAAGGVSGITAGAAGYNANNAGFLAGIDMPVNQTGTRLGVAVGYGETWLKDGAAGKASLGTARAGMFASQPVAGAIIAADVMYGALDETTTRQTGIAALQAQPNGTVLQGGAQAETWAPMAGFTLAPAAGLRFAIVDTNGFAESAGGALTAFALRGASSRYTSVQPFLNVTASLSYLTATGVTITPDAMLGYAAELGDRGKSVAVTAADGTAFASGGAAPDTSAAELSAGLAAGQGNWSLYAKYSAELAGNWTEQSGEAGLQVRF